MLFRKIVFAILCSCFLINDVGAAPNIVFVLADDMGYGDVQALNKNSKIPTPHLNSLARDGMTFTDAHTGSSVCTPTRYGLLTGRYCWRGKLKRGVINGYGAPVIEGDRQTVASFLRGQGYRTGVVGKWHLGFGFQRSGKGFDFSKPVSAGAHTVGFDYSYVIPASLDFPPYVFIEDGNITQFPSLKQPAQPFPAYLRAGERAPNFVMNDVLDDLTKKATEFIAKSAMGDKPFLLYYPLTAPHKPVLPHPRFRGKSKLGPYGDYVMQVDWTVGQIIEAIDNAGVADNTLLIYSSDNGSFMYRYEDPSQPGHVKDETVQGYQASNHTANSVFRGTKADIWEAGHHVPFFARWPAKVKASSKCDKPICLTDFFATCADIAGGTPDEAAAADSFSILPLLRGQDWETPRAPVIHHSAGGMFAIRDGKWKLVLGNGSGGRQMPRGKAFQKPYALFDLSKDIGERNNVIEQFPDVAKRLETECLRIRDNEGT